MIEKKEDDDLVQTIVKVLLKILNLITARVQGVLHNHQISNPEVEHAMKTNTSWNKFPWSRIEF